MTQSSRNNSKKMLNLSVLNPLEVWVSEIEWPFRFNHFIFIGLRYRWHLCFAPPQSKSLFWIFILCKPIIFTISSLCNGNFVKTEGGGDVMGSCLYHPPFTPPPGFPVELEIFGLELENQNISPQRLASWKQN